VPNLAKDFAQIRNYLWYRWWGLLLRRSIGDTMAVCGNLTETGNNRKVVSFGLGALFDFFILLPSDGWSQVTSPAAYLAPATLHRREAPASGHLHGYASLAAWALYGAGLRGGFGAFRRPELSAPARIAHRRECPARIHGRVTAAVAAISVRIVSY
jgi:hypothetical protein